MLGLRKRKARRSPVSPYKIRDRGGAHLRRCSRRSFMPASVAAMVLWSGLLLRARNKPSQTAETLGMGPKAWGENLTGGPASMEKKIRESRAEFVTKA